MGSSLKDGTIILSVCCVAISGGFLLYKLYSSQLQKTRVLKAKCLTLEDLHTEVISEIISYLSVEDLLRCRSVWKQLNVDIKNNDFFKRFKMHKTPRYFCNFGITENDLATKFIMTRTLAICDGLKLKQKFVRRGSQWRVRFYIKNPSTQKRLLIPTPPYSSLNNYAFSFVSSISEYKIALIYSENTQEKCALLTLDTEEKKWRNLNIPGYNSDSQVVVQANTNVHCVRDFEDAYEIVSLDLETECFSVTNVDKKIIATRKENTQWAISWNGVLSFVCIEGDELKVLVLEDYKTQKWGDKFVVPLSFVTEIDYVNKEIIPLSAENGLIWFKLGYTLRLGFDVASRKVVWKLAAKSSSGPYFDGGVFCYVPSYIVLKGMHPTLPKKEKSIYHRLGCPFSTVISKFSYYLRSPSGSL